MSIQPPRRAYLKGIIHELHGRNGLRSVAGELTGYTRVLYTGPFDNVDRIGRDLSFLSVVRCVVYDCAETNRGPIDCLSVYLYVNITSAEEIPVSLRILILKSKGVIHGKKAKPSHRR